MITCPAAKVAARSSARASVAAAFKIGIFGSPLLVLNV
jgi:hypothetical protein